MVMITVGGVTFGKTPGLKSVQHGSITLDGTSSTDTIDAVVTANSLLLFLGQTNVNNSEWREMSARIELTDETTVTAYRNTDDAGKDPIIKYCVLEFYSGVIKSNQSGTITLTDPEYSDTATIDSVDTTKSCVSYLGAINDANSSYITYGNSTMTNITLTNATTVTTSRTAYYAAANVVVGYQVVEFY